MLHSSPRLDRRVRFVDPQAVSILIPENDDHFSTSLPGSSAVIVLSLLNHACKTGSNMLFISGKRLRGCEEVGVVGWQPHDGLWAVADRYCRPRKRLVPRPDHRSIQLAWAMLRATNDIRPPVTFSIFREFVKVPWRSVVCVDGDRNKPRTREEWALDPDTVFNGGASYHSRSYMTRS
jgi:hypothetical protein